jgi:uncharacterized protein YbcI
MPASKPEPARPTGGRLLTAISNAVIRVLADHTGRGPTRARTVISGDWIFITLEDALTKGERKLVSLGRREFVMHTRRAFQEAMRDDLVREIEALTGRKVLAFLSDNHLEPDLAIEAVLLEPESA